MSPEETKAPDTPPPVQEAPKPVPEAPTSEQVQTAPEPSPASIETTPKPPEVSVEVKTAQPEPPTAQIPANEPLPIPPPAPASVIAPVANVALRPFGRPDAGDLAIKARAVIQSRKRKKLEKIIEVVNAKGKITNDQVEKLLHVSDATATRYLAQLEKEGKLKQEGKTGKGVSYQKI